MCFCDVECLFVCLGGVSFGRVAMCLCVCVFVFLCACLCDCVFVLLCALCMLWF